MKVFSDNQLKLMSLDYAERNKIVNQKTIKAYQDAVRTAEKSFTPLFSIKYIAENWDRTDEQIKRISQEIYYGGWSEHAAKVEKQEFSRLHKERELARACKKYLENEN